MKIRIFGPAFFALALAGCSSTGHDSSLITGSTRPVVAPSLVADVAPHYAAAFLPTVAGGVEGIRQTSGPERIDQTIVYPNRDYGAGENVVQISIARPSAGVAYYQAPSLRELQADMRRALPGTALNVNTAPGENLYGVFGYALGRSEAEGNCIYGWQTIKDVSRGDATGMSRFYASRYAARVRVRFCDRTMSEDALVSLMRGLRVREVTASTLEMLRFAEGSGTAERQTPAAAPIREAGFAPVVTDSAPQGLRRPDQGRIAPDPVMQASGAVVEGPAVEPAFRAPRSAITAIEASASAEASIPQAPLASAPRVRLPAEVTGKPGTATMEVLPLPVASRIATPPIPTPTSLRKELRAAEPF